MRKLLLVSLMLIITSLLSYGVLGYTLQIEDGITNDCGSLIPCSYWIDYSSVGTRFCTYSSGTCTLSSNGYFTMNTSGASITPYSKCSVSINVTSLTSSTGEELTVTINGLTQTMPDQGSSGSVYYTFPAKFNFTYGQGKDIINFTGSGVDNVVVDYFVIDNCESTLVPEFSNLTLAMATLAIIAGLILYKRH